MSAFLFTDEAIHRLVVAVRVDRHFFDLDRSLLGGSLILMNEAAVNQFSEGNVPADRPGLRH